MLEVVHSIAWQHDCEPCYSFETSGYWGQGITHCKGCHRTWPLYTKQAHCVYCHRHFSSPSGYDAHLRIGTDGEAIFHTEPRDKRNSYAQDDDGTWYQPRQDDSLPQHAPSALSTAQGPSPAPPPPPSTSEPSQALKQPSSPPSSATSWIPRQKSNNQGD